MAVFLPNTPPRAVSPEVSKVIRALKSLPDAEFIVWQRLAIWEEPGPDFLVLKEGGRAVLVKVSDASSVQGRSAIQPELIPAGTPTGPIGQQEEEALAHFVRRAGISGSTTEVAAIPAVIAFPSIPRNDLRFLAERRSSTGIHWVSGDELRPESARVWIESHLSAPIGPDGLETLRKAFTPEAVVPAALTVRTAIGRHTEAELTDFLLDYDQEWVLKCDLDLNEDAKRESKDLRVRLINGVAGSGKSLIIVYRALLLRRFFPKMRILVLTHNKALINDLEAKYRAISGGDRGVEWKTFSAWCLSQWPYRAEDVRPIGRKRRERLLKEAWAECLSETAITEGMLATEVDWVKDRVLAKRSEYLAADRSGRGFALKETTRNRVFDAIAVYQNKLADLGRPDWADIPRKIWGFMRDGVLVPPQYDAILVDEAQFFAPIWFEIIKRLVNPSAGHLFLAADPTQGFLGRRQSWVGSGLEVRGRSHRLNKSYRTTRRILDFATWLYRTRIPDDQDDIVVPNMSEMPEGVVPMIIPLTSPQDEITRAVNEITELVEEGVPKQHILVIHAEWEGVDQVIGRVNSLLGTESAYDPKKTTRGDSIRVCTLNGATGLEAPIVFLLGLKQLHEREQSLRVSDEERVDLVRDNTRKIYMAITRAGQRIVITYSGELPDWLKGRQSAPEEPDLAA